MSDERGRRAEDREPNRHLFHAIRQNWPMIVVGGSIIWALVQMYFVQQDLVLKVSAVQQQIGADAMVNWTERRVNTERDIKELRDAVTRIVKGECR